MTAPLIALGQMLGAEMVLFKTEPMALLITEKNAKDRVKGLQGMINMTAPLIALGQMLGAEMVLSKTEPMVLLITERCAMDRAEGLR